MEATLFYLLLVLFSDKVEFSLTVFLYAIIFDMWYE